MFCFWIPPKGTIHNADVYPARIEENVDVEAGALGLIMPNVHCTYIISMY